MVAPRTPCPTDRRQHASSSPTLPLSLYVVAVALLDLDGRDRRAAARREDWTATRNIGLTGGAARGARSGDAGRALHALAAPDA
jgi:hypothetical protein